MAHTILIALFAGFVPDRASAQSGTVTDDAFVSTNATTELLNLSGQGISLIVSGSSATVGSISRRRRVSYADCGNPLGTPEPRFVQRRRSNQHFRQRAN